MNLRKLIAYRFFVYRAYDEYKKRFYWFLGTIEKYFRSLKKPSIKLVAIAKNEACYLPEWIGHHLFFGFDQISIYVNNTTDNTDDIEKKLKSVSTVEFCNGDKFFIPGVDIPQTEIYKHEIIRSRKQGFSHVLFLDIDEFWTPLNLTTTIKEFVGQKKADVICFEWVNRTNEVRPFLPSIESTLEGIKGNHVKSLIATQVMVEAINPHSVLAYKAEHQLVDGSKYFVDQDNFAKISLEQVNSPIKEIFILHRMYRSQEEYVALLMRGRPIQNRLYADLFKTNRSGYIPNSPKVKLNFETEAVERYKIFMKNFFSNYQLQEEIELGKQFIMKKRDEVCQIILESPQECLPLFAKIFTRVTLPDINKALMQFKSKFDSN